MLLYSKQLPYRPFLLLHNNKFRCVLHLECATASGTLQGLKILSVCFITTGTGSIRVIPGTALTGINMKGCISGGPPPPRRPYPPPVVPQIASVAPFTQPQLGHLDIHCRNSLGSKNIWKPLPEPHGGTHTKTV